MAEPKKKTSKRRKGFRRKHHTVKETQAKVCVKCKNAVKPHTVCKACGTYNK